MKNEKKCFKCDEAVVFKHYRATLSEKQLLLFNHLATTIDIVFNG